MEVGDCRNLGCVPRQNPTEMKLSISPISHGSLKLQLRSNADLIGGTYRDKMFKSPARNPRSNNRTQASQLAATNKMSSG